MDPASILVLVVVVCVISATHGYSVGKKDVQTEAVKAGAGEWFVDDNGEQAFRFKTGKA